MQLLPVLLKLVQKTGQGKRGQSLVELLIAIGLAGILLPAALTGLVTSREGKAQQQQRIVAVNTLRQTSEQLRVIRDANWSNIAPTGTYHPVPTGTTWTLASGPTTVNGITSQSVISSVYRDSNQNIVPAPTGTLDPSTMQIGTTVSWNLPYTSSLQSTQYLTRYLGNNSYTETTKTQFNAGTKTGVAVTATTGTGISDDGQVQLAAGGNGDWCSPSLLSNATAINGQGSQKTMYGFTGLSVGSANNVYFGQGGNSSGDSFDHVSVSDPPSPSVPVISAADSYNNMKTYGLFGDNNYAYLTSDHPGLTLDIVQTTTKPYTQVGTANAGSNGISVFVVNNIAYVTTGNKKLYTFDLSTITGSHSSVGSVSLNSNGNKVVVIGNYAYIAESDTTKQLEIVQISNNGRTLSVVKSITVDGQGATDVFVNSTGTRAYLATSYISGKNELFIIDVDSLSVSYGTVKGSYGTNGMSPNGVILVPGNYMVLGGVNAEVYQVVNISNETTPSRCGGYTFSSGYSIYAISAITEADGDVFSYILTSDSAKEFKMFEGGPGGSYATNGTFESQTFNTGYQTANNRFVATFSQPSGTTIQFQVSLANLISGSCPASGNYTFVGPTGPGTWFTPASGESVSFPTSNYSPNYSNPGQCMRYKAQLTSTNGTSTPVLNDFTINYSP